MEPDLAAIALADDDPNDAFFARRAMELAHIVNPILTFETGKQLRDYLAGPGSVSPPALFVLDVNLAGGETGIEFLRWLRQQPGPVGSTPAVMLTGSADPGDRDEIERLAPVHFLEKPPTAATITAAVRSVAAVVVRPPA